jgi:hypothetical protein
VGRSGGGERRGEKKRGTNDTREYRGGG